MRPITIRTKIRGVSFRGAQALIAKCAAGEVLKLQRQPSNREDSHAIQVFRTVSQNGYLLGLGDPKLAGALEAWRERPALPQPVWAE